MVGNDDGTRQGGEISKTRRAILGGIGASGVAAVAGPGIGSVSANQAGGRDDGNVNGTPVLDWSQGALDAVKETGLIIPDSGRLYGLVHVAIYDAVNGINQARNNETAGEQMVVDNPAPPVASRVAAVAAAARDTLNGGLEDFVEVGRADEGTVEALEEAHEELFEETIGKDDDGNTNAGIQWGKRVASEVQKFREGSGFFEEEDVDFGVDTDNLEPGQAQLVDGFGNANLGFLDPWVFEDTEALEDFRDSEGGELLFDPGEGEDTGDVLKSIEWAIDYNKTKQLGNTGERDDDASDGLYPDAPDVENFVIDENDEAVRNLADDSALYEDATDVLERAVEYIESRETSIIDPDPGETETFDNESVEVREEDDNGTPTKVEIQFDRPNNFGRLGEFWVALGGTAQPEGRWFQIAHVLSEEENFGLTDNAELLKDLALASTEGSILGFNTKVRSADQLSWRPHAAIDSADRVDPEDDDPPDVSDDGNPLTEIDEEWQTISAHVPSTEHPSGLTLTSTAAQNILDTYFPRFDEGDDDFDAEETFEVEVLATAEGLDEPETITAEFSSFEQARRIAMDTREYTGRHYRYSLEASDRIGEALANKLLDDE